MRPLRALLAILVAVPTLAVAEWRDLHGRVQQDGPSVKGVGPLSAQLFFRKSLDETIQNWGRLARAIYIVSQPLARRGESIVAMVGFNGCTMTAERRCNLTVKYKVLAPSGATYGESQESELWQREDPKTGNVLVPGVGLLEAKIEATDELGQYTVEALIADKNSNASITLTSRFRVVE